MDKGKIKSLLLEMSYADIDWYAKKINTELLFEMGVSDSVFLSNYMLGDIIDPLELKSRYKNFLVEVNKYMNRTPDEKEELLLGLLKEVYQGDFVGLRKLIKKKANRDRVLEEMNRLKVKFNNNASRYDYAIYYPMLEEAVTEQEHEIEKLNNLLYKMYTI